MMYYNGIEEFLTEGKEFFGDLSKGLGSSIISIGRKVQRKHPSLDHSYDYDSIWAQYSLAGFPGCCGILVSTGAYVIHELQGLGLGNYFHKERLKLAKDMGYSCIMCTTIFQNKAEIAILEKNNWKKVHEFENSRTKNIVQIWVKDI